MYNIYDKNLKQKPSPTAREIYQDELQEDSDNDGDGEDYVEEELAPDWIETPSDDFYNICTTNVNRNPPVKSVIPRTPKCKPKPKISHIKPRYKGPVYLTKDIYDMLSEGIKKGLEK